MRLMDFRKRNEGLVVLEVQVKERDYDKVKGS